MEFLPAAPTWQVSKAIPLPTSSTPAESDFSLFISKHYTRFTIRLRPDFCASAVPLSARSSPLARLPRRRSSSQARPMRPDDEDDGESFDPDAAVELPIDGVLDLHGFRPREVKSLVPDYLAECRARGVLAVRIVHGKGDGTLRRIVHAALDRLDYVRGYGLAEHGAGGWGATQVDLAPEDQKPD
jgi:hypothetical protein